MKVFLSWSGELSKQVAYAFRDWLPDVIQLVEPYLSAEDIDKGVRWSVDIAKELQESHYGIIIITKDNMQAPWINFEAGALSKMIDKACVTPFLFNLKNSDLTGPLVQFQSTLNDKEEILQLMKSVNNRMPDKDRLKDAQLGKSFDVWYPHLQEKLESIRKAHTEPSENGKKHQKGQAEILEEVLELVRNQQRMLGNLETMLPLEQLKDMLTRILLLTETRGTSRGSGETSGPFLVDSVSQIHTYARQLDDLLGGKTQNAETRFEEAQMLAGRIHRTAHKLLDFLDRPTGTHIDYILPSYYKSTGTTKK